VNIPYLRFRGTARLELSSAAGIAEGWWNFHDIIQEPAPRPFRIVEYANSLARDLEKCNQIPPERNQ
jgi:hypothetical protein